VLQAFYQLKKQLNNWGLNYVFSSSIDVKISFMQFWTLKQTATARDNVFLLLQQLKRVILEILKLSCKIQVK